MTTHCWCPYMNREFIVRSTECNSCTAFGRNLKSVIHVKQFHPYISCAEPNQEIDIDFSGPIYNEKGHEIYPLAAIVRFSKFPTACIIDKANGPIVTQFLDNYIENHRTSGSIRLD